MYNIKKQKETTKNAKAALYVRVSTDAQYEEGYSVEAQQERLASYAKAIGIDNYEFYIDGGFSGSNLDRPEIKRLIQGAKDGKFTHVIVYKLDRISRSQRDTLYLIEEIFLVHNIAFISINESFDTSTPFGRAVIGILSVFAQLERENIFERTRMGMQKRVESGLWMGGGRVPYGYDYDSEKGILVPNKDAENVRKIYDLYLQGYSLQRISDILGLKYERLAYQILTRKSNAGYIVYNGVEYKGQHEAIISEEIYDKAMMMYKERSARKFVSTTTHLFTGLVYCGKCGAKMRYQNWGKTGYKFVCYSQQKSKKYLIKDPDCDNQRPWCDDIEEVVINALFSFSTNIKDEDDIAPATNVADSFHRQYNDTAIKLKRLYNLYAESGDELLLETIKENKAQLDNLLEKIKLEDEKAMYTNSIRMTKENLRNISELWDYMSINDKQNTVRSVIDKIIITDNKVDVRFKF